MSNSPFIDQDISAEEWREYEWTDPAKGGRTSYRIDRPARLVIPKRGSSTHRVFDADGIMHLVPAVGALGCIVRLKGPFLF